jgi:hypothetical protein
VEEKSGLLVCRRHIHFVFCWGLIGNIGVLFLVRGNNHLQRGHTHLQQDESSGFADVLDRDCYVPNA